MKDIGQTLNPKTTMHTLCASLCVFFFWGGGGGGGGSDSIKLFHLLNNIYFIFNSNLISNKLSVNGKKDKAVSL